MTNRLPPVLPGRAELAELPTGHRLARYRLLAQYLEGRNDRAKNLGRICSRLDPDGCITDEMRAHVVDDRQPFRRMVLRGAMIALGLPLPGWLYETEEVWAANKEWLAARVRTGGSSAPVALAA